MPAKRMMTAAAMLVIEKMAIEPGKHIGITNIKEIRWVHSLLPQTDDHPKLQAAQSKNITDQTVLPEKMQLTMPYDTSIQLLSNA